MTGRNLLGLAALVLASSGALVLIGLWARHSQETATPDFSYERGYPSRSINVVVPFPAGGPSDVVARVVTEQMGSILGQSMVIENVGGAGGTIGSARVAAAPSDGYTLLAGSMAYCGNARHSAAYPNDGSATCRARAARNNPLVVACVKSSSN
jgi:tripartite-type tricarboxylate transporter receptor subunit TctC